MADRVQFILDGMAASLREVEELEIFAPHEVKSIVKQRTDREYVLMRRKLEPRNFMDYIEYEKKLEKLLAIRCGRLSHKAPGDLIDAMRRLQGAFFKHICYIFDRAVRRFPQVPGLWNRYFTFLKEKDATKVLNKAYGKVIALYPKNEMYWIDAATHELRANNNALSARVLYQRAIRANKASKLLYLKYFELEVWYVLRTLERKNVLRLEQTSDTVTLFAVPLIIFKYAMVAIPDPSFAFRLHNSIRGVADDLGDLLLAQFNTTYAGEPALWHYLCSIRGRELDSLTTSYKDSDMLVGSGAAPLALLTDVVDTVTRGVEAVRAAAESAGEARVFALAMGFTLQDFCWRVLECLGACIVNRTTRGHSLDESNAVAQKAAVAQTKKALNAVLANIEGVSGGEQGGQDSYGHQAMCTEAMEMLERLALAHTPGKYSFSPRNPLAVWLVRQQEAVDQDVRTALAGGPLGETSLSHMSAWITAADRALILSSRSWSDVLLEKSPVQSDCDSRRAVISAYAKRVAAACELLVTSDEGSALLEKSADALVFIDEMKAALACVAGAMKASCCPPIARAAWWQRYLHMSVAAMGWEAITPVVSELRHFFAAKPMLRAGTDFSPLFASASNTLLTMLRGQKKFNLGLDSVLLSAATAVTNASLDWEQSEVPTSFYNYAAEVQTMLGNHKAANEIKERKMASSA